MKVESISMRLVVFAVIAACARGEFSSGDNQNKEAGVILTTAGGRPVDNFKDSLTVGGPRGPVLMEDIQLFERNALFNRERIPERVVHARGTTAFGTFKVTNKVKDITSAKFLDTVGKETPIAIRFSTVVHSRDSPDFLRDPRGYAVKFYTEEGNYDMAGLSFPVFWIRDGIRFPELVHSQKPNPVTGRQEWWRILDYLGNFPESTHILTFVLDDDGIPATHRHFDGFSVNTYVWTNAKNESVFVRYQFLSQQGHISIFDEDEAGKLKFDYATRDLYDNIDKGNFPKWDWFVQVVTQDMVPTLGFDPLDATKNWLPEQIPLRKVGVLTLNKNIGSQFLDNEQIAFAPSRFVPGIGPSQDKMLQSRLFAYQDAQNYRLGVNHHGLPVNRPKCPYANTHSDGLLNPHPGYVEREINYFPSLGTPRMEEAKKQVYFNNPADGSKTRLGIDPIIDEFKQPGDRYRAFDEARKDRLARRIAYTLSGNKIQKSTRKTWLDYWKKVDPDLRKRIDSYKLDHALEPPGSHKLEFCDETGKRCVQI